MNTASADASIPSSDLAWPDFYALLGVPFDAAPDQLRARLREAYLEATANADHRHVERRLHYQMMAQRIVPQARRILLEERARRAYDRQLTLHRNGDSTAVPYTRFVSQLAVFEAEEDNRQFLEGASPAAASLHAAQKAANAPSSTRLATPNAASPDAVSPDMSPDLFAPAQAVSRPEEKSGSTPASAFNSGDEPRSAIHVAPETSMAQEIAAKEALSSTSQMSPGGARRIEQEMVEAPQKDTPPTPIQTPDPHRTRRIRGESSTRLDENDLAQNTGEVPILQRVAPLLPVDEEDADSPGVSPKVSPPQDATQEPVVALLSSRVIKVPEDEPRTEEEAQRARVLRVERGARPLNTEQLRATNGQDLGHGVRGIVSSGRETANANARAPHSRVSVSENETIGARDKKRRQRGQRVLSQPVVMGLTALASAAAMFLILHGRNNNFVAARTGLRIVYSSDLQPVMEQAQRDFAATAPGRAVALDLQPVDSRDAMHLALGVASANQGAANAAASTSNESSATVPDVWIPGETLWSDRFNQVAGKFRRQSISVARSLAVSPLVLIARGDRASALKKRFPNRTISSWDALRRAVASDAPNHFGLTDPQRSGSGALVRLFMAREWCERNGVRWNKAATSDARLWKWMSGFEDNVPGSAALTGDMIKELAMGNSDRFWWGVGYESDALGWMKRGKSLEIFYLPRTALAQHPFCALERRAMTPEVRRARSAFETFLRSRAMQSALLQNGFRPTELGLSDIPNSPFARADFRARGLRAGGFHIDERINYNILNALNVQWKSRY